MNYRVIWVFPKRKFGVALHILNPHTGKILHLHLKFTSKCERSYLLTCLTMLRPRIVTFFVCSGVSYFFAVALDRLLPSFLEISFICFDPELMHANYRNSDFLYKFYHSNCNLCLHSQYYYHLRSY